ncbi:unnamed protein product [Arabis nemorensis]|uniref:Uncharacterized protein n=1 Tax=Arabis nemorensis TaxID=586526 RepID=A0A565BWU2_9BRAS|nr:unnamed protein product [Arabis nemorensis]
MATGSLTRDPEDLVKNKAADAQRHLQMIGAKTGKKQTEQRNLGYDTLRSVTTFMSLIVMHHNGQVMKILVGWRWKSIGGLEWAKKLSHLVKGVATYAQTLPAILVT